MTSWRALGLSAALLLATVPAAARPSIWDTARSPKTRQAYLAFVNAERMRERALQSAGDLRTQRDFTLAALALLEVSGAGELGDPRLDFLLGDLLLDPLLTLNRTAEAERRLERALARAPESPLAARALFDLGTAHVRMGRPERARAAYTRALALEWEPDVRSTLLSNRAEASLLMGDLRAAIADNRRAIRAAVLPHAQALAHWGLGVALERSGDLPSGLRAIELATRIRLPSPPYASTSALDLPGVFFVPEYEIHYYRALGAMAEARAHHAAESPEMQSEALLVAVAAFSAYIERAQPDQAPWVTNARLHRKRCEQELARAQAALERVPRPPRTPSPPAAPNPP